MEEDVEFSRKLEEMKARSIKQMKRAATATLVLAWLVFILGVAAIIVGMIYDLGSLIGYGIALAFLAVPFALLRARMKRFLFSFARA